MGFIQDFLKGRKEKENKFKEWQENDRIGETVQERKTSHYERELKKVLEKEKESAIKDALIWEGKRQQEADKLASRKSMKFNSELFNNHSILNSGNDLLRWGRFQ